MNRRIFAVLGSVAMSGAMLMAQTTTTPPSPPSQADMIAKRVARLTTLLSLTTAQASQATTIFTTEATAETPIRTSMRTAQTALNTAVKANNLGAITTEAAQIGTLTGQSVKVQADAQAAFLAILTPDQLTKYNAAGPGGGPGGPGGPGHGPGPAGFGGGRAGFRSRF